MSLADDIWGLQKRALTDLAAAHDYYMNTKMAWRVVHKVIKAGYKITINNSTTGTRTTQAALTQKSHGYVDRELAEATFQQFVSIFENAFFDLLRLWLMAYPQSLGAKELLFKTVLDAADKDAIKLHVVNKELNEMSYERPRDWFKYLEGRVKLGCPTPDEIDRIGEAKAARHPGSQSRHRQCNLPGQSGQVCPIHGGPDPRHPGALPSRNVGVDSQGH
jgi:hypothetical protein